MRALEKTAGEVGRAPFACAGVLVEGPDRVPMLEPDLIAGQRHYLAAEGLRAGAFLADGLALARGQIGEKGVETLVAAIDPVILLRAAGHQAKGCTCLGLRLGAESDMQRGNPV